MHRAVCVCIQLCHCWPVTSRGIAASRGLLITQVSHVLVITQSLRVANTKHVAFRRTLKDKVLELGAGVLVEI